MGRRRSGAPVPASPAAARAAAPAAHEPPPHAQPAGRGTLAAHVLLALCAAAAAVFACAPVLRFHAVYDDAYVLASRDLHTPALEWLTTGCAPALRAARPGAAIVATVCTR
jgi:hypothetical protein